jgi:hypothetical protein
MIGLIAQQKQQPSQKDPCAPGIIKMLAVLERLEKQNIKVEIIRIESHITEKQPKYQEKDWNVAKQKHPRISTQLADYFVADTNKIITTIN